MSGMSPARIALQQGGQSQRTWLREQRLALRSSRPVYDPSYAAAQDEHVWRTLRANARIRQPMDQLFAALAGREHFLESASDDEQDRELADTVDQVLSLADGEAGMRLHLATGVVRGFACVLVQGRRSTVRLGGLPPLSWWHPTGYVPVSKRRFRREFSPESGLLEWQFYSYARDAWEWLDPDFSRCLIAYRQDDEEDTFGFGAGLEDPLYLEAWALQELREYALRAAERFGEGELVYEMDGLRATSSGPANQGTANDELATEAAESIEKSRARHILVIDALDKLSLLGGSMEGHQILTDQIQHHEDAVRILLLSGVLMGDTGGGGHSLAMQRGHAELLEGIAQLRRLELAEAIDRTLVRLVLEQNRATLARIGLRDARAPTYRLEQKRVEDPREEARLLRDIAPIMPISARDAYRRVGYSPPIEDEETIGGAGSGLPFGRREPDPPLGLSAA